MQGADPYSRSYNFGTYNKQGGTIDSKVEVQNLKNKMKIYIHYWIIPVAILYITLWYLAIKEIKKHGWEKLLEDSEEFYFDEYGFERYHSYTPVSNFLIVSHTLSIIMLIFYGIFSINWFNYFEITF